MNKPYKIGVYCVTHDVFYDQKTREWLEKKCSDPECQSGCLTRPPKHLDHCDCFASDEYDGIIIEGYE